VRRRLLLALPLVLLGAGVAAVAWQATTRARQVETDLTAARDLLAHAGGFQAGTLDERLGLIDQAQARGQAAGARLDGWPLRQLGHLPLLGRDVRVARAVAASAADTVVATRRVVTAVQPVQGGRLDRQTIEGASAALLALQATLDQGAGRVRATRPLLAAWGARADYLQAATTASRTAAQIGQGLRLAATLYGPPGRTRWFLALQNPAELRGTGGLIGQYGILESSPTGPKLVTVAPYESLERRTHEGVPLSQPMATHYQQFAVERAWSAVNIPPDLPTVGRIVTRLYRSATGQRIDGVVAADPLAVAAVLQASGPITAGGVPLDATNVADETLVQAYVRYATDNEARHRFLAEVARGTFAGLQRALSERPVDLVRGLAVAARGRHVQLYASDPAAEEVLRGLGLAGTAAAPAAGDYLMAVGVNAGGNKLDAFLHRTVRWRVQLAADGSASADAAVTLANDAPAAGLPRYVIGPYDGRFRAGVNEQVLSLYVAGGYGFSRASLDGRPAAAEADTELGGVALTQQVAVPAGTSATVGYRLARPAAAERVGPGRLRYRLLLRPQATARPDQARVVVVPPPGWHVAVLPPGARLAGAEADWSGDLDREHELVFDLTKDG
jgi:hypothetical protein